MIDPAVQQVERDGARHVHVARIDQVQVGRTGLPMQQDRERQHPAGPMTANGDTSRAAADAPSNANTREATGLPRQMSAYGDAVFTGALSRISQRAASPIAEAPNTYQASAIGLPVTWISQVTTHCVVPPKMAMVSA